MIAILLLQSAWAAQVMFRIASDDLREGQTVALDLIVSGATPRGVPAFEVPPGLQVAFQRQTQAEQILNFERTSETTFRYALTMLTPGEFLIPTASVSTREGVLTTSPVRIEVQPRKAGGLGDLVATVESNVAWVGQVVVYHLRFETEDRLLNGTWSLPTAVGFTTEPSTEPRTREYAIEQDGKPRSVMELDVPLRAAAAGASTIAGAVLRANFAVTEPQNRRRRSVFEGIGAFSNVRDENYAAKPIPMEVRALPTEGRPSGDVPLVGRFSVSARVSDDTAKVGDTVTVELTVTGDGDLGGYHLPALDAAGFRVYDDQPVVEARVEGGRYLATASFKRAIVPEAPGPLELPALDLPYFDPVAGAWATARVEPIQIRVEGEEAVAKVDSFAAADPRKGVDSTGEDILPIRTDPRTRPPWSPLLALTLLLPGSLALLGQALSRLGRRPPKVERVGLRFEDLPGDPEARLIGLERIFRENAALRLGISPEALKAEHLVELGDLQGEAHDLYRLFERARFGGRAENSPEPRVRAFTEAPR